MNNNCNLLNLTYNFFLKNLSVYYPIMRMILGIVNLAMMNSIFPLFQN